MKKLITISTVRIQNTMMRLELKGQVLRLWSRMHTAHQFLHLLTECTPSSAQLAGEDNNQPQEVRLKGPQYQGASDRGEEHAPLEKSGLGKSEDLK